MKRMLPLATAVAALLVAPAAAQAAFPGGNGRIAFNWTFGCDGSMIATMNTDGEDRRLLTEDACQVDGAPRAAYPDWSADGERLVFLLGNRLATMNADGSGQALLALPFLNDPGKPSLGPGGQRVAYTSVSGGHRRIYSVKLDGTDERRLRRGSSPRFSPNGKSIAFVNGEGQLAIMRASDGELRRRLDARGGTLDWSPDGKQIVYSNRYDNLYVVNANGKGSPRRLLRSDEGEFSPAWSPNGKRIAFVRSLQAGEEDVRYGVFKMRADGEGRPERIYRTSEERTEETLEALTISWQPRP